MEVRCAFSDRFIPAHTRPACPRRDMPPLSGCVVGSVGGMSPTIGDKSPTRGDRAHSLTGFTFRCGALAWQREEVGWAMLKIDF